jgi:hypothetical protein
MANSPQMAIQMSRRENKSASMMCCFVFEYLVSCTEVASFNQINFPFPYDLMILWSSIPIDFGKVLLRRLPVPAAEIMLSSGFREFASKYCTEEEVAISLDLRGFCG